MRLRVRKHRVEKRRGLKNGRVCELRWRALQRLVARTAAESSVVFDVSGLCAEADRKDGAAQRRAVMAGGSDRGKKGRPRPQEVEARRGF